MPLFKPRGMLLEFLELKSEPLLASEPGRKGYLQRCLCEAIEGLHALEYGEAQPIFTPRKTNDQGLTPYSAKKFRMIAVGFVDLLQNKGKSAGKAQVSVAKVYNVSKETIKDWQQDPGKTSDPWMQNFRKKIAVSTHWSHQRVREELSKAAKNYIVANTKKKEKKTAVKKTQ